MFWTVTMSLLKGFGASLQLFGLTLVFALPLGLVVAFGSMNKWRPLAFLGRSGAGRVRRALAGFRPISALVEIVVWVIRGTPLMLQLIIIFYCPGLILGHDPWGGSAASRMAAAVVAFVINYACYFSVIYRGGIEGVPAGQQEAGQVLGLTRGQIFRKITFLQVVKRIVPPMSNEIITLVKDTSLARIITVIELTFAGQAFMKSAGIWWPLLYTGVFYLVFVGILTLVFGYIERRLGYFK